MNYYEKTKINRAQIEALAVAILACGIKPTLANPKGGTVRQGSATIVQTGSQMTIKTSPNTFIDWRSFNINTGETTTFNMPSSQSVVWNRINDANPSQILGNLNANGFVVLMNQNGFYFGKDSVINVGGFLATSSPILQPSDGPSGFWQFSGPPPTASIINYGQIIASPHSAIYLVSQKVENHGTLTAPDGTLGLYAGKEVSVCDSPDGRGLSAKVTLPEGSVDNTGKLIADAGTIALHAKIVNQDGVIEANSVREHNGVIELVATDTVNLGPNSQISAKGGSDGVSDGGKVTIKSDRLVTDAQGSHLDVGGGAQGGNGGVVELCADQLPAINSKIDGGAQSGWTGGNLSIDPKDIVIGTSGNSPIGKGTIGANDGGSSVYNYNVKSSFIGFSRLTLDAKQTITIGTDWNLADSTGIDASGCKLTLDAGRIVFKQGARIEGGANWSVELNTGWGTPAPSDFKLAGWGGIYLNGGPGLKLNGAIETQAGSITMHADNEVIVGGGYIRTVNGGSINIVARDGNVDAGQGTGSLVANRDAGMIPNSDVGGIATVYGGDLTIKAGNMIKGLGDVSPQLIGCYGAGDVNLTAKTITGHFVITDGIGTITGTSIGTAQSAINLALKKGSWNLHGTDIFVNEIYNPNGIQNSFVNTTTGVGYSYDYSADASIFLDGLNSVHLLDGSPMTRQSAVATMVLPSKLNILAGDGGVELGNTMVLYPSANASLNIATSGSLYGSDGKQVKLIMSDSDSLDYRTFVDHHSLRPLQMPSADSPVTVTTGGDIRNLELQIPKKTLINVGRDTENFFFTGQNLLPGDVTKIDVQGDIKNHLNWTTVPVDGLPDLTIFDPNLTSRSDLSLNTLLSYDPIAKTLTFNGRMTPDQRDFLLNPVAKQRDALGNIVLDPWGNPTYVPVTFVSSTLIQDLYKGSLEVSVLPAQNYGILIGGPGKLQISARNMDLGITMGVRSTLDALNPNLVNLYNGVEHGADIDISLGGNLQITSSRIASFNGGSINLASGGSMDIGSQASYSSDDTPKGIWTGAGGSVKVVANGDINVDGSRIGSFDGGDVWVESKIGKVDAGQGGRSVFGINCPTHYDPVSGTTSYLDAGELLFGSGILSMTRAKSDAVVGNITVLAKGDIICNGGGVMQLPTNLKNFKQQWVHMTSETGDIVANNAGVIGVNPTLEAPGGKIFGLIVGQGDVNIHALGNVDVNVLSGGTANVASSSGELKGMIVAVGNVSLGGETISATAFSTGGETKAEGDSSGAKLGSAFAGVAVQSVAKTTLDASETVAKQSEPALDAEEENKKSQGKKLVLAKSTGRVTVILPKN